jgi:hypothetical protein
MAEEAADKALPVWGKAAGQVEAQVQMKLPAAQQLLIKVLLEVPLPLRVTRTAEVAVAPVKSGQPEQKLPCPGEVVTVYLHLSPKHPLPAPVAVAAVIVQLGSWAVLAASVVVDEEVTRRLGSVMV